MELKVSVDEVSWLEIKQQVKKANAGFFDMIEKFNPGKDYTFLKASYPFGSKILDQGKICLPTNTGGVIPLDHDAVPESIRKQLQYSSVPIGFLLNRSMEVFFETSDRVMPSKLFSKGSCFGLWEVYDKPLLFQEKFMKSIWNLSAGARSLFMLPKIADDSHHRRLKRDLGLNAHTPKVLLEHSRIFEELVSIVERKSADPWRCEILFFTEKWSRCDNNNINSLRLHNYWLQTAWDQSLNCRRPMDYSVAWEIFSNEVSRRNWKVRPYIINTMKHLIAISDGVFPGFVAARDESVAPIKLIQDCYVESYLLKDYAPIIMQPSHINHADNYVYYSMNFPTLLELAPKSKISGSVMSDLRELKMLAELFVKVTGMSNMQYEYFHADRDNLGEILTTTSLPFEDSALMHPSCYTNNKLFPASGAFLKGCVRVKKVSPLSQRWNTNG